MCLDDSARVSCLDGDCDAAVEKRTRVISVRDPGCHAHERVGELTSSLAHRTERLHCVGTNVIPIREVGVLRQFAFGCLISESAGAF